MVLAISHDLMPRAAEQASTYFTSFPINAINLIEQTYIEKTFEYIKDRRTLNSSLVFSRRINHIDKRNVVFILFTSWQLSGGTEILRAVPVPALLACSFMAVLVVYVGCPVIAVMF